MAVGYSISQISRLEHNERLPDELTLLSVNVIGSTENGGGNVAVHDNRGHYFTSRSSEVYLPLIRR